MRTKSTTLVSVMLLLSLAGSPVVAETLAPDPAYSPQDVVRIVMEALHRNDQPYEDAGLETTFRFASPANKRITGPIERFISMVKGPVYGPMVNFQSVYYEDMLIEDGVAIQSVILTAPGGEVAAYRFRLSKQGDGEFEGAWMTDAVMRFEVPENLQET